jgi:hypothetical protein
VLSDNKLSLRSRLVPSACRAQIDALLYWLSANASARYQTTGPQPPSRRPKKGQKEKIALIEVS